MEELKRVLKQIGIGTATLVVADATVKGARALVQRFFPKKRPAGTVAEQTTETENDGPVDAARD